jgi:hypothetical protein
VGAALWFLAAAYALPVLVEAIHTAIERDFTSFVNTVLLFFACLNVTLEPA